MFMEGYTIDTSEFKRIVELFEKNISHTIDSDFVLKEFGEFKEENVTVKPYIKVIVIGGQFVEIKLLIGIYIISLDLLIEKEISNYTSILKTGQTLKERVAYILKECLLKFTVYVENEQNKKLKEYLPKEFYVQKSVLFDFNFHNLL